MTGSPVEGPSTVDRALERVYRSSAGTRIRRARPVRLLTEHLVPTTWIIGVHARVGRAMPWSGSIIAGPDAPSGGLGGLRTAPPTAGDEVPRGVTPFVVLASGRSGSTLLVDELNRRWDEIRCLRERFNGVGDDRDAFREALRDTYFTETGHRFAGCKIFYGHVAESDLRRILGLPGMRVVILRRTSVMRKYVSLLIAKRHVLWHQTRGDPALDLEDRKVTIDPRRYLVYRDHLTSGYDAYDRLTANLPVHRLTYEALATDLDGELRKVATFLGAGPPSTESAPRLVRQNPEPLRALISNYDEVHAFFENLGMVGEDDPDDPFSPDAASPVPAGARQPDAPGWPNRAQTIALHLALDPPGDESVLVEAWLGTGALWTPDDGVRRLYPLIHRRLAAAGVRFPTESTVRTAQVHARADNLRLLHHLSGVLDLLQQAEVDTVVLKGAALALLHYEHVGDRPMHDLDVMVRPEEVPRALAALRAAGWSYLVLHDDTRIESLLPVRHSVALVRDGVELDLHWHAMVESVGTGLDAELWATSVALEVDGQATRALGPADQVLHAVVHGLRWNPVPTIRWVADAHTVITSAGRDFDWRLLADRARRYHLGAPVRAAITYLDGEFPGLVPPEATALVAAIPVSAHEQHVFEHGLRPHGLWGTVVAAWHRYRRRTPRRNAVGALAGFAREMTGRLDLAHAWRAPGRLAREATARMRRRRTHP